jgi:amino acid permease
MDALSDFFGNISTFFTDDPILRASQAGIVLAFIVLLFLLFWTLRDIILRTRSFSYQFGCVLLVAAVPVVGFLLYLLIRPARTLKERETDDMLRRLTGEQNAAILEPTETQEPLPLDTSSTPNV